MTAFGTNYSITPPGGFPAALDASGVGATWTSQIFPVSGPGLAAAVKMNQAGGIQLQRYLDAAGALPIGSAITASVSANTVATLEVNDGTPFLYAQLVVQNTSGSACTISSIAIVGNQTGH